MSANIETTRTKDRLLISILTKDMEMEETDDFLSFFKLEFLVCKNEMTDLKPNK